MTMSWKATFGSFNISLTGAAIDCYEDVFEGGKKNHLMQVV